MLILSELHCTLNEDEIIAKRMYFYAPFSRTPEMCGCCGKIRSRKKVKGKKGRCRILKILDFEERRKEEEEPSLPPLK